MFFVLEGVAQVCSPAHNALELCPISCIARLILSDPVPTLWLTCLILCFHFDPILISLIVLAPIVFSYLIVVILGFELPLLLLLAQFCLCSPSNHSFTTEFSLIRSRCILILLSSLLISTVYWVQVVVPSLMPTSTEPCLLGLFPLRSTIQATYRQAA